MNRIPRAIILPAQLTDFERSYLRRVNRIGLVFFALHVPIFTLVALFNDTGPLLAAALTGLTLVGPALAYMTFENPRSISMTYGFTAMVMGALLVHFGQGPVQIEMHFYFFALLAMLALYGNPLVIIVAAVTVAVHHLVFWIYLPSSVFNYDAPVWVVAVHAAFVVLESIATCYIARSFFDNVIGLEKIVKARTAELDARNRDLQLILDSAGQGFISIDGAGDMSPETSAVVEDWFGAHSGDRFVDFIGRRAPRFAEAFDCGWFQVCSGVLPVEVALDQLPDSMELGGRHFEVAYYAAGDDELDKTVVVISDVTDQVRRAALEAEQRETFRVFERLLSDKSGFFEFYEEAEDLIAAIAADDVGDLRVLKRITHTLKGNASLYGLQTIADMCHAMEALIDEEQVRPGAEMRASLLTRWQQLKSNLSTLIGDDAREIIEIGDDEYRDVLAGVLNGEDRAALAERIARWKLEPTRRRCERIAEQAARIARRLGKDGLSIDIRDHQLYMEPRRWAPFWSSFVHVIRNAVDHGIETAEVRAAAGKPGHGRLTLVTELRGDRLVIELSDDGAGVNFDAVRERALERGLEARSCADLIDALFADGLTTSTEVTELSGRGVGLAAVREACRELDGEVSVDSRPGLGTTVSFNFPAAMAGAA